MYLNICDDNLKLFILILQKYNNIPYIQRMLDPWRKQMRSPKYKNFFVVIYLWKYVIFIGDHSFTVQFCMRCESIASNFVKILNEHFRDGNIPLCSWRFHCASCQEKTFFHDSKSWRNISSLLITVRRPKWMYISLWKKIPDLKKFKLM